MAVAMECFVRGILCTSTVVPCISYKIPTVVQILIMIRRLNIHSKTKQEKMLFGDASAGDLTRQQTL